MCVCPAGPATGVPFKSSMAKKEPLLRFTPTNLHVERMAVTPQIVPPDDDVDEETAVMNTSIAKLRGLVGRIPALYHNVTVGAPAAHTLKFKGGLGIGSLYEKLLSQQVCVVLLFACPACLRCRCAHLMILAEAC